MSMTLTPELDAEITAMLEVQGGRACLYAAETIRRLRRLVMIHEGRCTTPQVEFFRLQAGVPETDWSQLQEG
jgi:hypothetical protein